MRSRRAPVSFAGGRSNEQAHKVEKRVRRPSPSQSLHRRWRGRGSPRRRRSRQRAWLRGDHCRCGDECGQRPCRARDRHRQTAGWQRHPLDDFERRWCVLVQRPSGRALVGVRARRRCARCGRDVADGRCEPGHARGYRPGGRGTGGTGRAFTGAEGRRLPPRWPHCCPRRCKRRRPLRRWTRKRRSRSAISAG